ncbi:MAG: hypothetical protein ACI80H_000476 [Pseudoalteromonas distincta]|jgi:hypothetical protein
MKKIFTLVFVAALFASCSDDPATTPTPAPTPTVITGNFLGVWNFDGLIQTNGSITWDGDEVSSYSSVSSNEVGTVEYKSDGTVISNIGYDYVTTLSLGGDQEFSIPQSVYQGTYTHDANANTLTSVSQGQSSISNIIELTANSMVLQLEVATEQVSSGIVVRSSNTTTITYSK